MKKSAKEQQIADEQTLIAFLVVEINPQFYWGSGKTEQGYK